mmetsp:Transcript_19151/g.52827  ORF Transcript_19151/g.52827 Transcript_19151/m.52827 type:complete len:397 (+) Transcript_19151:318-1508(+)|eukprot:CAMPEP_0113722176 /NCGR_PEP_ID=MMETSP0038_2-20120614/37580_1 /TAXON_ID=2898 /ORGANISM="Cryptomonas paramecium" /LENGTH=396 /DNA_ID=CAMNT_0000651341 /DNA_START=273 /DNA_END=1463 /DNA_ORIENTATION=+ /assembly_acc=CAM_ASM_000170
MVYTEADVRRQMESLNDFNVTESTQLVFNLHDFNNDRVIDSKDVEEFKKYTNDNASSVVEMSISNIARHAPVNESKFQENKEFFRKLDSDLDGSISYDDMRYILSNIPVSESLRHDLPSSGNEPKGDDPATYLMKVLGAGPNEVVPVDSDILAAWQSRLPGPLDALEALISNVPLPRDGDAPSDRHRSSYGLVNIRIVLVSVGCFSSSATLLTIDGAGGAAVERRAEDVPAAGTRLLSWDTDASSPRELLIAMKGSHPVKAAMLEITARSRCSDETRSLALTPTHLLPLQRQGSPRFLTLPASSARVGDTVLVYDASTSAACPAGITSIALAQDVPLYVLGRGGPATNTLFANGVLVGDHSADDPAWELRLGRALPAALLDNPLARAVVDCLEWLK